MANVIHRQNLTLFFSVDPSDYPLKDWIINPNLSKVVDVPRSYWKIVGNEVLPMTQPERDAVDAASVESGKQAELSMLDNRFALAVVTVMIQQINQLRKAAGLPVITRQQFRNQVYQALQ